MLCKRTVRRSVGFSCTYISFSAFEMKQLYIYTYDDIYKFFKKMSPIKKLQSLKKKK